MKKHHLFIALLCYINVLHADDSVQGCKKALESGDYQRAVQIGLQAKVAEGALCAGRAQQAQGDLIGAASAYSDAERLAQGPFERMLAITFLARANRDAGKMGDALGHYARGLKIARELGEKQAQMINLNESGEVLLSSGDAQAALDRFREASTLAANDNERSECNQLMAAAYGRIGEHDKAIEFQLKSVLQEERSGTPDAYMNARLELSAIYVLAKEFSRAQKELEDVMDKARNAGSSYWESRTLLYVSRLETARGKPELARSQLKRAADLAASAGAKDLGRQIESELQRLSLAH